MMFQMPKPLPPRPEPRTAIRCSPPKAVVIAKVCGSLSPMPVMELTRAGAYGLEMFQNWSPLPELSVPR